MRRRTRRISTAPHAWLLIAINLLILPGCSHRDDHSALTLSKPVAAESISGNVTPPHFVDVAQQAGLNYHWSIAGSHPYNILQTIGNGCAFLDYNNDGNLDILLVGPKLALYRGDGHGHFVDVTHETGLDKITGNFLGCAVGDYDNDGYEDLYLSAYRGGALLHNIKGRRFEDVTRESGIQPQPWGTSCAFADIDNDGKLDLYIGNYVRFGPGTQPQFCDFMGHLSACGPAYYKPEFGVLYHNEGQGRFRDVTHAWKADAVSGYALGVAFADYDGSGRQSLAIANDEVAGDLLRNVGHEFRSQGILSGAAYDSESRVHAGMGIDWGDYNNDGRLDQVVTTFQHEPNCVYHNDGNGLFSEQSAALGIANSSAPYLSFGVKWVDYDNDGWLDLVWASGHVIDVIGLVDKSTSFQQLPQLFHNNQGTSFTEMSDQAGPGFQTPILGRGLAVGDFDNDGRMDILIVNSEGAPLLLHNLTANTGHWLCLRLQGVRSNRDGIGAMVTVSAAGQNRLFRCGTDGSYLSASDRRIHVGLGPATSADTITIRWPSGSTSALHNIAADRVVDIREDSAPK